MANNMILIGAAVFFVILAGLFAGAETGIYRLSRLRLRLGIEKKQLSYVILGRAMHDSPGLLLSMLTGTNLAHYFTTSIVTVMLLREMEVEHAAELFAMLIVAPTLFVFSELIPKNIFFYRSDYLMPSLGGVLFAFQKLFTWSGIVPLLRNLSRLFAKLTGTTASAKTVLSDVREHHIKAILQETHEEGLLSPVQTDLINRIVGIPNIYIKSVMTPINKVEMIAQDSDKSALSTKLKKCSFTRLPVYDNLPTNIIGFINIYEAVSSGEDFTDLRGFTKPIRKLAANTRVIDAINIMQKENQKMVLVTRTDRAERERPVGIVTMKDLVEELLGELTEW